MKKFCSALLIIYFFAGLCGYAESTDDAIYLDLDGDKNVINYKKPKEYKNKSFDKKKSDSKRFSPQNIYDYESKNPYAKQSTSFLREKKYGNFSLGTKYDTTFSPDSYSQKSTMFAKYQKNKFSLNTSYKNDSFAGLNKAGKGTFSFTPEYKLNNHVSLQNIYSTNFLEKNRKNELVFTLKPFKDDRMNFGIGAGQIYSEGTAPIRSQLNFSTKFNF